MDRIQKVCPALGNSATPPSEKSPPRPQLFRSLHGFPPGHGAPPLETLEKAKPEALLGPCLRWSVGEHGRCGSFPMWNNDEPCVVLLLEQWIFQKHGFCFWFSQMKSEVHGVQSHIDGQNFSVWRYVCVYQYKYTVYRFVGWSSKF